MNERDHLCALSLDRLLLSSMSADEERQAGEHLEACEACRTALEELRADQQRFAARVFARTLPPLEARACRRGRLELLAARLGNPRLLVPVGLAVALLLVVARPAPEPDLRIKGGPTLKVFARRQGAVFQVRPDTRLAAGDRIRFVIEPERPGYLLVASVDGAGTVSVYFPPEGGQSAPVGAGRSELPGSIELDDAPGPERLFAYFSEQPLPAAEVARALAAAPGAVVSGVKPLELSFAKEQP